MIHVIQLAFIGAVLLGSFATTFAHEPFGKIVNHRQARQAQRINQGLHSGALTQREAFRLHRAQARIHRAERFAKRDGQITPREMNRLDRLQDRQSQAIYNQKHDQQTR